METNKREFAVNGKRSLPEFLKDKQKGRNPKADNERKITKLKDNSGKVVKVEIETIKK